MKKLIAMTVLFASSVASAHYLPDMTCAQARSLVRSNGAVVLWQTEDLYDRYVVHQGYCDRDETTRPAYVSTADSNWCFIGYTCVRQTW